MTASRVLALLLGSVLAAGSVSALRAQPVSAPRAEPVSGLVAQRAGLPTSGASASSAAPAAELRDALRRFYLHELSAELGLSADRASALAPRLEALLDAHRAVARDRIAAGLLVRKAASGAGDPAAALEALSSAEEEGRAGISAARAAVMTQLDAREQALFLAFEEPFRERVRRLAATPRAGAGAGADAAAGAGQIPGAAPRPDSVRDTLRLVFVHELRVELGLDDARTLLLLGPIDRLLAARMTSDRARRAALERLRSSAADESARPEELTALVKAALEADRAAASSLTSARQAILSTLSPREACQFILVEQRFIGQARRQLRGAQGLRERGRGAERPMGKPAPGRREGR